MTEALLPTGIVQQTAFWSRVKARMGWSPAAFDLRPGHDAAPPADILVVLRRVGLGASVAYVPFGPEYAPVDEERGLFLERISEGLRPLLPSDCIFVRYDLPWRSPYGDDRSRFDAEGNWLGAPEPEIRELRMNITTENKAFRKAETDIMPPDTVVVDLAASETEILARMKPKTRYNIGLAAKKGVQVVDAGLPGLPAWYALYRETAARHGFVLHDAACFESVLMESRPDSTQAHLLLATRNGVVLSGMILAIAGPRATYLYGASSGVDRDAMAGYALQWSAMRIARAAGAVEYDLFGCAPRPDPGHPLYGLWGFKTGFGGTLIHRQGCWDYPLDPSAYAQWRIREMSSAGFHL
ncbi:MAG TPA: peptidoglycan bridge formation glycyltransferase FemA/FemB family protein [Spirochaetia bacterium]